MLNNDEAVELINKFIELRKKYQETKDKNDKFNLDKQEKLCIEKFSYLVGMRTNRYKNFNNYDDLNQEGYVALVKAMKNYNPNKGSFFWWAHKYIDTRIARSANLHTTIRYPLKIAKENIPHKENSIPLQIEYNQIPDIEFEQAEIAYFLTQTINNTLTSEQKQIIELYCGFGGDKPMSVGKICKQLNIPRTHCIKQLDSSLALLKETIKL